MKTQQDMRDWLDKDHPKREIHPKFHVHGWRVALYSDYHEVCIGWGETIEEAFTSAEKCFDVSLAKLLDKTLFDAIERRDKEIQDHEYRIKRIRKQQQDVAAKITKSVHES